MQKQISSSKVSKGKVVSMMSLFVFSILIMLSGVFFIIFSLVNHISLPVLNSNIHGAIFGLLVAYLGLRKFLSVKKLKKEVYKDSSRFSWSNFKKSSSRQLQPRSR